MRDNLEWNISERVKSSRLISHLYRGMFYLDLGRGQVNRVLGFVPELTIIFAGMKYLFGFEPGNWFYAVAFLVVAFGFTVIGIVYRKMGFYHVEQYTNTRRSPVNNEILETLREIRRRS